MFDEYDCNKICECEEPDFNDAIINSEDDCMCVHCDLCGGVPNPLLLQDKEKQFE